MLRQRREPVEARACIGRDIGPGRQQFDPVARCQRQRQAIIRLLIENIRPVAGRAGDRHRPGLAPSCGVVIRYLIDLPSVSASPPNRPMSRYTQRTGSFRSRRLTRTTSACTRPASPTMKRPGSITISGRLLPKCSVIARHDGIAELIDPGHVIAVTSRETAAQIHHPQIDAGLGQIGEQHRYFADRRFIGPCCGLLAADMERQPVRIKPQFAGLQHQFTRTLDRGAEFA